MQIYLKTGFTPVLDHHEINFRGKIQKCVQQLFLRYKIISLRLVIPLARVKMMKKKAIKMSPQGLSEVEYIEF